MDKRKKTAVTIVMTCILILIMALVIMYRIKENNNRDKTPFMSIIKFISPLGYLSDDS